MRTLAVLVLLVRVAVADRHQAEQLEAEGKAEHDIAKLVACGQAYVAVHDADPAGPGADEPLYNAGVCFEEAASVGAAITVLGTLRVQYPNSRLAPRALARLAMLYERANLLPQAAAALEEYSSKYAGEKDALDALSDAVMLRQALGDDAKRVADTQFFIRMYAPKRPAETAQAMFGLAELAKPTDAVLRYRDYVRMFGGKDRGLVVRAHSRIAELLYAQACPVPLVEGLCVKAVRPPAKPPAKPVRCGASTAVRYTAVARDAKLVREALASAKAVESAFVSMSSPDPAVVNARARAQLVGADIAIEEMAAVTFPTGLNFTGPAKAASTKRFNDYVPAKQKLAAAAHGKLEAIIALGDATTSVAAFGRDAFAVELFASDLAGAEIPADVRTGEFVGEKIAAFCEALANVAEPLQTRAVAAAGECVDKAATLGVATIESRRCELGRGRLAPKQFSSTIVMLAEPPVGVPIASEPAIQVKPATSKALTDALAAYTTAPHTWPACQGAAKRFETIGGADAFYMAGHAYASCGRDAEAKRVYERAGQLPAALSNRGAIAWRAGDVATAKQQWTAALALDGKLAGAHTGLAAAGLRELSSVPKDQRAALVRDIDLHATSAMAVDPDRTGAYVALAILAIENADLPRAKYYAARARRIDEAAAAHVLAVLGPNVALAYYQRAGDPLALGVHYARLHRWTDAQAALASVKTPSYALLIARGVLAHGQGKLADAEARYRDAIALAGNRPEAHFDLGVVFQDQAARAGDMTTQKAALRKAAEEFKQAGTTEAKQLAVACEQSAAAL